MFFSCCDFVSVSGLKKNTQDLMVFDSFMGTTFKHEIWPCISDERQNYLNFNEKVVCRLSVTDSTGDINTWSTSQIDFSTQSECMDKPFWGMINRETISRILPRIWPLTVFWMLKNSNFENSWIWWPRQGVNEFSRFECCKRSRVMCRCAQMS